MAFLAIVFKGGIMLGAPLTLGLIAMFGYEGGAQVLDSPSAFGIRICASLLPAALLSVPMIFMWRFPIDAARHSEIRAALEQRAAG
jgi:Na+/melibiose symporter-like transporter